MDIEALVRSIAAEVLRQMHAPQIRVRILGQRDAAVAQMVAERIRSDVTLVFAGEEQGTAFDRYILPFLSCSDMADLATGRAGGDMAAVLQLLLQGNKVEALELEYHTYAQSASHTLFALYAGYEKQLAAYGLTLLGPKRPDFLRVHDGLITEKTVLDAAEQGASTLVVPLSAVITPLAAEAAGNLQMKISKQS